MKLDKIITLANKSTELRFLAMERSLRSTGCTLPLWVIPYDDNKFDLPEGATWWEVPEIINWLNEFKNKNVYKKYQCLITANYQFVDADVVFLKNPETALFNHTGFITSCGHWHNPSQTFTTESLSYLESKSTTWQKNIFNTGQFACDRPLYENFDVLKATILRSDVINTCLDFISHEQPGINYLVNLCNVPITNLTLPPVNMQSTWAGDYKNDQFNKYWLDDATKPYLIHWAGCKMDINRPIDQLFLQNLTQQERIDWDNQLEQSVKNSKKLYKRLRVYLSSCKLALKQIEF